MTVGVHDPEIVLTTRVALFGGHSVPAHRLGVVLDHAMTVGVHVPEVALSVGVALFGGHSVPAHRLGVAPGHTVAIFIHHPEIRLSVGVALFGGHSVPAHRLGVVTGHSLAGAVHEPEIRPGCGVATLGKHPEPRERRRMVASFEGRVRLVEVRRSGGRRRLPPGPRTRTRLQVHLLARQRPVQERLLPAARRDEHRVAHAPEHHPHLDPRLLQVPEQGRGVGAVPPAPVRGHRPALGRVRHQRAPRRLHPREPPADRARRPRTAHRRRERVVPAGIEYHQPQPRSSLHRRLHHLQRHRLQLHHPVVRKPRVHRHQEVALVHLDAVPGVEHHRHLRPRGRLREIQQPPAKRRVPRVLQPRHREAEAPQRGADVGRVVEGIRERRCVGVGGVADDQRHPWRCQRGCREQGQHDEHGPSPETRAWNRAHGISSDRRRLHPDQLGRRHRASGRPPGPGRPGQS